MDDFSLLFIFVYSHCPNVLNQRELSNFNKKIEIDLEDLPSGLYFISIINELNAKVNSEKIINEQRTYRSYILIIKILILSILKRDYFATF